MNSELSALERTCIELIASEHWPGFRVDALRVTRREDTGIGRYIHVEDGNQQDLPNGTYETGERSIEMKGLRLGLDFAVAVISSRIDHLELVTAGSDGWDGVEREWRVV